MLDLSASLMFLFSQEQHRLTYLPSSNASLNDWEHTDHCLPTQYPLHTGAERNPCTQFHGAQGVGTTARTASFFPLDRKPAIAYWVLHLFPYTRSGQTYWPLEIPNPTGQNLVASLPCWAPHHSLVGGEWGRHKGLRMPHFSCKRAVCR